MNRFFGFSGQPKSNPLAMLWSQVINEPGTSFANFTGGSGTWSSDGIVIKQTNNSGGPYRARYNTNLPIAYCVYEAEIQIKTSGAGDRAAGLIIGFDGTNGSGLWARLHLNNDRLEIERDSATAIAQFSLAAVNIDTWYKVRLVTTGALVNCYVDSVLVGSAGNMPAASGTAHYLGISSRDCEAWFRNIKAWVPTLPA